MKNMQNNYGKIKKKQEKQKVQTHGQGLGRGLAGDMGLNFLFFCFFLVFSMVFLQFGQNLEKTMGLNFLFFWFFHCFFAIWPKPRENQKKQKKQKSSDPWARSGERPGRGHGSELFVFFGFLVFPWFFCNLAKTSRKPKKQKVQTHGQGLGRGLAGDMGLNFLFFFFFGFSIVFCMFFM